MKKVLLTSSIAVVMLVVLLTFVNKETVLKRTHPEYTEIPSAPKEQPVPTQQVLVGSSSAAEFAPRIVGQPSVTTINADIATYANPIIGIAFDYPVAWGDVVIKEVEKGHFQASFIQRLDERGVPVKFFAYKTENYNPTGRGGYWGDFASEELNFCESQNHDYRCEELTVDNRTVTSFQEIPFGCDVEGAVPVVRYLVPNPREDYVKWFVFTDQEFSNGCANTDTEAIDSFSKLIKSIHFI